MSEGSNVCSISLTVKAEADIYADAESKILRAKQHQSILFRINLSTKLKKMKRAYCTKVGVMPEFIVFFFGGYTVSDSHCALDLYMVDGDTILVNHDPKFLNKMTRVPSSFSADFEALLHSKEHSDVVLVVGKDQVHIPAIKAILCARSEKFKGMLSLNFIEGHQKEVVISDKQPHLIEILLKYLYTDAISMPEEVEDVASLLMLADEFLLPVLKRECEICLSEQVRERNACSLLQTADVYSAQILKDICKQFILDNFDTKPSLGEELQRTPHLLLEITHAAISGSKRKRLT